jgi:hypothetical protein
LHSRRPSYWTHCGPRCGVSTTCPNLFNTMRSPADAVGAVPSVVGRLPTTHPLARQGGQGGGEPDRSSRRVDLGEGGHRSGPGDFHDARARALQVGRVIEVAHQSVAAHETTHGLRHHRDPLRIHVAIGGDRRRHAGDSGEVRKEGCRPVRCGARSRDAHPSDRGDAHPSDRGAKRPARTAARRGRRTRPFLDLFPCRAELSDWCMHLSFSLARSIVNR